MCPARSAKSLCRTANDQNQKSLGEEPGKKEGWTGCLAPEELDRPWEQGLGLRGEGEEHLHKIVRRSGPEFN